MYKIEFTLKQHTPIIHFQHEQEGATLRASEVKPKLDRFIIQLCKEKGINYKNWLIGKGEHNALNYKIKLIPYKNQIIFLKTKELRNGVENPLYFGNIGNETPPKHYSIADYINSIILSNNKELLELFTEPVLCNFFFINNFGARQSKGFGSFYPIEINKRKVTLQPQDLLLQNSFWIKIDSIDDDKIFRTIDYFWKWLKSGINFNRKPYEDSILKLFISEKTKYKWEKKKIKEHFLGVPIDSDIKYFVRAFLGLADNFSYKWVPHAKRVKGETYSPIDLTIHIESKNPNIQRNPSPFIFIPYKFNNKTSIYIRLDAKIKDDLLNCDFELSVKKVDPIKLITGYDTINHNIISKTIFKDTSKKDAEETISKAINYCNKIIEEKKLKEQKKIINKAKDFVNFFNSSEAVRIKNTLIIKTPSNLPNFEELLEYTLNKIGSSFEVKDFQNQTLITANFESNAI